MTARLDSAHDGDVYCKHMLHVWLIHIDHFADSLFNKCSVRYRINVYSFMTQMDPKCILTGNIIDDLNSQ